MAGYVLANPLDVYSPFNAEELTRLRRYADRVENLLGLRFFQSPGESVRTMSRNDGVFTTGTDTFDQESLMAVAGPFRILYKPQEKTSFMAIMKLLISHVRSDSVRRPEALGELRDLRKGRAEILSRSTIRMILERRQADGSVLEDIMTTERLIDLWLHGHFLHGDEGKAADLDEWNISGVALFEFCAAVRRFAHLFCDGRIVARYVIECPGSRRKPS